MKVLIGIDVGKQRDPTAFAVTQVEWRQPVMGKALAVEPTDHYLVRYLERMPLGTAYPDVAARVKELIAHVEHLVYSGTLRSTAGDLLPNDAPTVTAYIDATGVGQPVVDMVRRAGVTITGVYITGTDQRVVQVDPRTKERSIRLGKSVLVSKMQVLMQTNRLHFIKGEEAKALAHELSVYEIKVTETGTDQFGAFKTGAHDDLATAVGLCVQEPNLYMGGMASTPGHKPQPSPEWWGVFKPTRLSDLAGPQEKHALDKFRGGR